MTVDNDGTERVFVRPGVKRVTLGSGGRYYVWKRQKYWSVSTIIKAACRTPCSSRGRRR